jgi:hypothetical protein
MMQVAECANHESSTVQSPLPELNMTSTKKSPRRILASQCAKTNSAPIRETVQGEDPEIFPFVGSSRLENPINQFRVSVVFHGHAHNGTFGGKTSTQIPVYNVALPIVRKQIEKEVPLFVYEL